MAVTPHHVAPVLQVSDLDRAVNYYTNVLGFLEGFRYQNSYAGVNAGSVSVHLAVGDGGRPRPVGASNVYFFLNSPDEVDAFYAEIVPKGATIDREPENYPYGMRDFAVRDPDGNLLIFGADTEEAGT